MKKAKRFKKPIPPTVPATKAIVPSKEDIIQNFELNIKDFKEYKSNAIPALLANLQKGSSITDACEAVGIDFSTLWNWRKKHPELDRAIKQILEANINVFKEALVSASMKRALGFHEVDERMSRDGTVVKVNSYFPPDTTMAIFLLCNLAGDRFKNLLQSKVDVHNQNVNMVQGGGSENPYEKMSPKAICAELARRRSAIRKRAGSAGA